MNQDLCVGYEIDRNATHFKGHHLSSCLAKLFNCASLGFHDMNQSQDLFPDFRVCFFHDYTSEFHIVLKQSLIVCFVPHSGATSCGFRSEDQRRCRRARFAAQGCHFLKRATRKPHRPNFAAADFAITPYILVALLALNRRVRTPYHRGPTTSRLQHAQWRKPNPQL